MAIVVIVAVLNLFVTQGGQVLVDWGILRISEAGVQTCLFMGARLTIMMLGMSLITLTTMTIDLTEAFEWVLKPFARFGVPAHELGMIMGIALRFMPQFANELAVVYHAQVSRGARLSNSPARGVHMLTSLMVPLFTSVFRHAETLSAAHGRTLLPRRRRTHAPASASLRPVRRHCRRIHGRFSRLRRSHRLFAITDRPRLGGSHDRQRDHPAVSDERPPRGTWPPA